MTGLLVRIIGWAATASTSTSSCGRCRCFCVRRITRAGGASTPGAYPGAPHEGSGWNGGHSGPLQMTNPWAGYYAPNGDWNTNWMVAFWTAERVAAAHGFSYVWMRGQWPATYPPCAGRF
jgi:hypothetical protein